MHMLYMVILPSNISWRISHEISASDNFVYSIQISNILSLFFWNSVDVWVLSLKGNLYDHVKSHFCHLKSDLKTDWTETRFRKFKYNVCVTCVRIVLQIPITSANLNHLGWNFFLTPYKKITPLKFFNFFLTLPEESAWVKQYGLVN